MRKDQTGWVRLVVLMTTALISFGGAPLLGGDREDVQAAHEAWVAALNRQDIGYIQRHALAELSMFNARGRLRRNLGDEHWRGMAEAAGRAGREKRRVEHEIEEIRVYGEVAMVNGHSRVTVQRPGGEDSVMRRRLTYVWVRTLEGWRQAHHHVSALEEAGDR